MANAIYDEIQSNSPQNQFSGFMKNPFGFLLNRKIDIPQEFQSDPHSAVDYLVRSGKMDQNALNGTVKKLQRMGFNF